MQRFLIGYFICFCFSVNAQDTIYKRTGEVISSKALEITITEINYKRFDMQDGPLFVMSKNDIEKIKYANGMVEFFTIVVTANPIPEPVYVAPNQLISSFGRNIFYYQNKRFSDRGILFLIEEKNQLWKSKEINLAINASRENKKLQYSVGFGGAGLAILSVFASAVIIDSNSSSNTSDNNAAALIMINGVGLFIASQVVSYSFKLKRIKHANRAVDLYNAHL